MFSRTLVTRILLAMFLLFLLLGGQPARVAHAATTRYVSTTGADSGNCSSTPCATIAYAISQAASGDTISIAAGTYTQAGIVVNKSLTIGGAGASSTIVQAATSAGTATDRVFYIGSGLTVTLENMTIRYGNTINYGSGIQNNGGTLNVINSTISDNRTTFWEGGGIDNRYGTLNVINSTISNNSTAMHGGGISSAGGTAELRNSTISNNSASSNGGGIYRGGGTVTIYSTIVANNTAGSSGNDCYGTITSGGYNLVENTTSCTFSTTTGDLTGQDPLLAPLGDYGGSTNTHALKTGSPALEQIPNGTNGCGTTYITDQRGETRPVDFDADGTALCDMGAFETQGVQVSKTGVTNGSTASFDNAGRDTYVDITLDSGGPCDFTVTKRSLPPTPGDPAPGEMPIHWNITSSCGTLQVDLVFGYTDTELTNGNNITEGNLVAFKNTSGTTWTNAGGTVNTVANTVTVNNVTSLSGWTIGDPTSGGNSDPTAITLRSLTARSSETLRCPTCLRSTVSCWRWASAGWGSSGGGGGGEDRGAVRSKARSAVQRSGVLHYHTALRPEGLRA